MRLIVGLGNPGEQYRLTPHNAGFWVCDRWSERHGLGRETQKFKGLLRRGRACGGDIAVLKPQTYMNLSGESVAEALRYLPIELADVVVVYDEMDLPAGKLRIRPDGGHGGHNGMRSLIEHLGGQAFPRIRVGVGRPPSQRSPTSHLLSRMDADERERLELTADRAADALDMILEKSVQAAMNHFNGMPAIGEEKAEEDAR
jgi:PTH1 family peptidyl-tRNA hydrolase